MPSATQRKWSITFLQAVTTTNEYNESVENWGSPTTLATRRAKVRFGSAQEKREAAQEGGVQTATFECVRSTTLNAVTLKNKIGFDGSQWDIVEKAPLSPKDIRFTATRTL